MSSELTKEDICNLDKMLEAHVPPRDLELRLPASDFSYMSDKQFTAMVKTPNLVFVGGSESVNKLMARCRRLKIK